MAEKFKFEIYAKNCGYVTNSKKFLKRTAPVNSGNVVRSWEKNGETGEGELCVQVFVLYVVRDSKE